MVLSIISQVNNECVITGSTAAKQSSIDLKWAATKAECLGGKSSNCKVSSVVKAKVPSLPANSLQIFNFPVASEKTSVVINSSIA